MVSEESGNKITLALVNQHQYIDFLFGTANTLLVGALRLFIGERDSLKSVQMKVVVIFICIVATYVN